MGEFYYECNLGHWEFPYSWKEVVKAKW
jgi:hypothetical protein